MRLPAAPGMALRGRGYCRVGVFSVMPFPDGAGMCPLSGGGAPNPLPLAGAGCETLWRGVGALGRGPEPQRVRAPRQRLKALELSRQARRGERGKVLLCAVKWRLSCRGAGARSPGGIPVGNTGAGQSVSLCENLVNHMFKRLPPPRPDIIIHL